MKHAASALQVGAPPDFLFSTVIERGAARWAYEDRLADLAGVLGPVLDLFDGDTIEVSTLLNGKTGQRGLYALPMSRVSNYVHVWNSLLERAGFTLADVPQGWEAFWSFWCDQVQPAVRKALGRNDVWGVGLSMSAAASDTMRNSSVRAGVQDAMARPRPPTSGRRSRGTEGLVKALDAYTAIWRKGCTPPNSVSWTNIDNNKAFLAQTVVMTPNPSLSIPSSAQARAARGLLNERRDHRMAGRLPMASRS